MELSATLSALADQNRRAVIDLLKEQPRRAGDPPTLVARAQKIRSVLGWSPRLDDLDTIVKTSLLWEEHLKRDPW